MATKAEIARENGKKGGRPKGSTTKPRISDYLNERDIDALLDKAYEMAVNGNEAMLKFILEQKFGKAVQPTDMNILGNMTINFDPAFKK